MAAQHTPGPWIAETVGSNIHITIDRPDKPPIAWVGGQTAPHAKANARLIAAAPDLLKALEAMLDVQSARRHPLGAPDEGIAYMAAQAAANARDAIAKAKGGE